MCRTLKIEGQIRISAVEEVPQIWVHDGVIHHSRPEGVVEYETIRGFALPGLVDAHAHVGLDAHGAVDADVARAQAQAQRDAGALLLRDAGSPSDTRWMDDESDLPRVIRAGRHIARTRRYIRGYADEIEPEQLPAAMALQASLGGGWVKIVGDWIDREAGDLTPCWPDDALRAGISAAHAAGARVTAHCFSEDSLEPLVEAGIDCIEHGTGLTGDTVGLLAERGVALVPTLVNIRQFPAIAEPASQKYPTYHRHMLELWRRRHQTVRDAHEAGVPVYAGTDAGGMLAHGLIAQEVEELVLAGLSPLAAVGAATWDARRWLRHPGLDDGSAADLIVYPADPLEDVAVLRYPRAVVLRGCPVGHST